MHSNNNQHLIDRILKASLKLAQMKDRNTFETFVNMKDKCRPHKLMENMFSIHLKTIMARKVWTLAPIGDRNEFHVLFLHGGAYVSNMTPAHWFFVGSMIQKLNCTVVIPDYPLAPAYRVNDVFGMLIPVYQELIERAGASRVIIMGDSAGGGMALALAQLLRDKKMDGALGLCMLSPWLDVNMDNPDIRKIDAMDPILNIQGLIDSGKAYAGDADRTSFLVSPLYGSLQDLPPGMLFVGTHELMLPDARKFRLKAAASNLELDYHEIPGLIHDGMLFPTPEGKNCRTRIFSALQRTFREQN